MHTGDLGLYRLGLTRTRRGPRASPLVIPAAGDYLKRYESVVDAHKQIGAYLTFYNDRRPHSAHGHATPNEVYHAHHQTKQAA